MPILNVKISGTKNAQTTKQVADMLLDHTVGILKKKHNLIAIVIDYVDHDSWIIAGKSLTEHNKNSFSLEIKVTDETNTKDEKAAYIKAVFAGFETILGNVHPESYIHVHDVRAAAYGYGGLTQEYRYQKG